MNRQEALSLLKKHVKSEQLLRHCLAVEAGMKAYAKYFDQDIELWGNLGILHDIDFEKYPDEHPKKAPELLSEADVTQDFIDAILSHGLDGEHLRVNEMRKTLSAVDQMSSFIVAVALVRPTGLEGMKVKSVKKKIKDKGFAKAVNRQELEETREALGIDFSEHISILINGLQEHEKFLNDLDYSLLR